MFKKRFFLILFLSAIGCMVLPLHSSAYIPEDIGKTLEKATLSGERDMDALVQTYPFLQDDIQKIKDRDKGMKESSPAPKLRIAEVRDGRAETSLFFMGVQGTDYCGSHGCPLNIYVDDGSGYKKALEVLTFGTVFFKRNGKEVQLFFDTKKSYAIWELQNGKFVRPPPLDAPDTRRDEKNRPVDEQGRLTDEFGNLLKLDRQGRPVDSHGRLIKFNKDGRIIYERGKFPGDVPKDELVGKEKGPTSNHENESGHSRMHGDEDHDESGHSQKDE